MYIAVVPNRGSRPAVLLRESYRDGGKVKNRTIANLSRLPEHIIDLIRRSLHGETFLPKEQTFAVTASRPHGDTQAVTVAMRRLGFAELLSSRPCRERDIISALVVTRILRPSPKLATTRFWKTRTVAEEFSVLDADENDVYAALDWLLERQPHIEKKLAKRHLKKGSVVLYDLSSSYFEGKSCSLARLGYNRDGKKGKPQVNYGLRCTKEGCPVGVDVFAGNVADAKTFIPQVERLKKQLGVETLIMVGDRGMVSQASIDVLKEHHAGIQWVTALKSSQIRSLVEEKHIQLGLFDEKNLFELCHPDYPGERLVACKNPDLAKKRAHVRRSLLEATERELGRIQGLVERGRLKGKDKIGVRIGRVVDKYKVAKHFALTIEEKGFTFARDQAAIDAEAALDGIYVIRTSVDAKTLDSADAVRTYKSLTSVERAFRSLKTVDLEIRPIHHRVADRVRAHIFLCMLAYWVEWHMREAWASLLFADEERQPRRDPVAPARPSASAIEKATSKTRPDGTAVHSFKTLLDSLATIVRNTCQPRADKTAPTFSVTTEPDAEQHRALDLLEKIAA